MFIRVWKSAPARFYYTSYWNLRTFSCGLPFPSLVSFCISQRISGLDPHGGREPELAHFWMHGHVDSPSCHEHRVDELHPWHGSSQTQVTEGLESHKLAWKLEWKAKEEREKCERMIRLVLWYYQCYRLFLLWLNFWEATGRDIPKPFSTVIVQWQSASAYETQRLIRNGQPIPYGVVCNLYKMVLLHNEGREIWWCYTSICIYVFLYRLLEYCQNIYDSYITAFVYIFFYCDIFHRHVNCCTLNVQNLYFRIIKKEGFPKWWLLWNVWRRANWPEWR